MTERDKVENADKSDGARSTGSSSTSRVSRRPPKGVVPKGFKPFQPGVSGNPSGRREMPPEVKAALASAQLPAILKQIELLSCGDPRIEFVVSQALLDRFSGKALQATDVNVTTTNVQQAHLQVLVELQQKRDQAMKTIEAEEGGTQMVEEYGPLIAGDMTYTKDNS